MSQLVVVTGSGGYLGNTLVAALQEAGWTVCGLDRTAGPNVTQAVDLLDAGATARALARLPDGFVLIHLAAIAHGQRPPRGETTLSINVKMLENVVAALGRRQPHFVFFSSVAVYGEDGRREPITVDDELRPATEYGESKRQCEERLAASGLRDIDILRLAPVFDDSRLTDVRKRVFPVPMPLRVRLTPPPFHSLCHRDTVCRVVGAIVARGRAGRVRHVLAEERGFSQHELCEWFDGSIVSFPSWLARPLYFALRLLPGRAGYTLRSVYWKFFESNLYVPTTGALIPNRLDER